MKTQIRALFKRKEEAVMSCHKLRNRLKLKKEAAKIDDISDEHKNLVMNRIDPQAASKLAISFALLGVIVGVVSGTIIQQSTRFSEGLEGFSFAMIFAMGICGLAAGVILYFVKREGVVPLAEDDLAGEAAVVTVRCDVEKMKMAERILLNNNADRVLVS